MTVLLNVLSIIFLLCIIPSAYYTFKGKMEYYTGVFSAAFCTVLSLSVHIFAENIKNGVRIIDVLISGIVENTRSTFNTVFDVLAQNGISADEIAQTKDVFLEALNAAEKMYRIVLPALIILFCIFTVSVVFSLLRWIMQLMGKDTSIFPSFADKRLTKSGAYVFILSYIFSMFMANETLYAAFVNMTVIIGAMAVVCGLSYIDFRFKQKLTIGILRFIIYCFAFFVLLPVNEIVVYLLMFIGLLDSVFNYRLRYIMLHGGRKE